MKRRSLILLAVASLFTGTPLASAEEPIPLVEMENVRLPDAIRQLARKARLNVILDPRLAAPPFNEMTVSIRWENVTAKEALAALLDNHDLVMIETQSKP